jgi:hypothetical protein
MNTKTCLKLGSRPTFSRAVSTFDRTPAFAGIATGDHWSEWREASIDGIVEYRTGHDADLKRSRIEMRNSVRRQIWYSMTVRDAAGNVVLREIHQHLRPHQACDRRFPGDARGCAVAVVVDEVK